MLFGAGDPALLQGGGLAIVGSRDVDDAGQAFAGDVARWCARGGMPVISGGARGVDQIAYGVLPATIYEAVLPVIEAALSKPTGAAELATRLAVSKAQLEIWLSRR
ncbi:MAG: hypothetical protein FJ222_10240 [Lentisphaerae bacterium]|nr:hypothetical protein [Lentisphaerota bacterium]